MYYTYNNKPSLNAVRGGPPMIKADHVVSISNPRFQKSELGPTQGFGRVILVWEFS